MSEQAIALRQSLQEHFPWQAQRINFLASFLLALLAARSVNLARLAAAFTSEALVESNYKRLQRFFGKFSLEMADVTAFVVKHLPASEESWVVSIDRTDWKLGRVSINFLVVAVVRGRLALPVCWIILAKAGASNTRERIDVVKRFLERVEQSRIAYLLADREFIGREWFQWLIDQKLDFTIRVKESLTVTSRAAHTLSLKQMFSHLKTDERCVLRKPRLICGCRLYLSALRLCDGELLLVVSPRYAHAAIEEYRLRWPIETLFGCLKSRGFDLEATHLTKPERLERLFALLTIATLWAYEVGTWLDEVDPLAVKSHTRRAVSTFRRGLDFLINTLMNIHSRIDDFIFSLQLLSCT